MPRKSGPKAVGGLELVDARYIARAINDLTDYEASPFVNNGNRYVIANAKDDDTDVRVIRTVQGFRDLIAECYAPAEVEE